MKLQTLLFGIAALLLLPFMSARADLRVEEDVWDFGHVGLDFTVLHEYKIYNDGPKGFLIDSARITCDCSQVIVTDSMVEAGGSGAIRLSFTTTNFYGPNNKIVKLYTNDPEMPEKQLFYLAIVGQWFNGVKPDPISLFFLPPHKSKTVSVTNTHFNHIRLDTAGQSDTLFTVTILNEKARRGEKVEAKIEPKEHLNPGTYHANVRFRVEAPDSDPVYLTVPVKIVRY